MARLATRGYEAQDGGLANGSTPWNWAEAGFGGAQANASTWTPNWVAGYLGFGVAMEPSAGGTNVADYITLPAFTVGRTYYARTMYKWGSAAAEQGILSFRSTSTGAVNTASRVGAYIDTSGHLFLDLMFSSGGFTGSPDLGNAIADGQWHRVELALTYAGVGATNTIAIYLDGTLLWSYNAVYLGAAPTAVAIGGCDRSNANFRGANGAFDDVAVNDDQGANQNGLPGDGKVWLLKPTADSARGANWVAGAGGTTSLFAGVDNTPPVGVVIGSATNTSQIKNAAKDTTGLYDATMQSYNAAGIPADHAIALVQGLILGGPGGALAMIQGAQVTSNPAIAEVTTTSPATAVGTHPTGWIHTRTAVSYSPSVTRGTAPVMRVRKGTSSTTALTIDEMFLVVESTPAPVGPAVATGSDSLGTTDAATRGSGSRARAASENLGTADAATRATSRGRTASETLGTSDAATRPAALRARTTTDAVGTSDAATRAPQSVARAAADSLGTTDAAVGERVSARTASDALATTDVATRQGLNGRSAADTLGTSDATVRVGLRSRSTADVLATSDSASRGPGLRARSGADALGTSDAATRGAGLRARSSSDVVGTTDAATRGIAVRARTAADTLATSDASTRAASLRARATSDTLGTSDAATRALSLRARAATDALGTSDAASTGAAAPGRSAADALGTTDAATRQFSTARAVADTLATSDAAMRAVARARTTADALGTADAATRAATARIRAVLDALGTSDAASRAAAAQRVASDTLATTDAATVALSAIAASDTLGTTDIAARAIVLWRFAADSLGTTDQATFAAPSVPGDVALRDYLRALLELRDYASASEVVIRDALASAVTLGDRSEALVEDRPAAALTLGDRTG